MEKTTTAGSGLQLILLAAFLIPAVLFLLTQQNTLRAVRRENRKMQPGWVWLQLIPLLGQVWQFVVVSKIAGSIRNQWQAEVTDTILGIDPEAVDMPNNPTLSLGITYCVLSVLTIFLNLFTKDGMPTISGLLSLATMICWIIYWVNLAAYKRKLKRSLLAII